MHNHTRIIISGWLLGKILIMISFRVGISKNKNIDHRVKETCAIMSTQVAYENFFFYVFYCDLKEKFNIRRNINYKKKETFVCGISIIIILICQKLGLFAAFTTEN